MIDIQFIRENPEVVQKTADDKNVVVDVARFLELDRKRLATQQELEQLRSERNEISSQNSGTRPSEQAMKRGKELKEAIDTKAKELEEFMGEYSELYMSIPNMISEDTPIGGEENNEVVATVGDVQKSGATDHLEWLLDRKLVDFERAAKVSGSKFYYSMGDLASLEMAVMQYALSVCEDHGFTRVMVPNMVHERIMEGTGFLPRGEEKQIYQIDGQDLQLIATSEIPLTGLHSDEVLDLSDGPILYAGFSPCYRLEAGAYGKHERGLYRNHQFYKVEMYAYCEPKDSVELHEKIRAVEEEIFQALHIPYQVVINASADLGAPAYKKYDIEYYSAVDGEFRELSSCSNVTDYQARRCNIKYKNPETGKLEFVHTLNGTAMVSSRGPIAIIENNQTEDSSVRVPEVLQKFMNKEVMG